MVIQTRIVAVWVLLPPVYNGLFIFVQSVNDDNDGANKAKMSLIIYDRMIC